jgi:hypothetical protein
MKNDLTPFEKNLLKAINSQHKTSYDYNNLMEWGSTKGPVEKTYKKAK